MHILTVGKSYCLRLPDGRPLGHVWIEWLDEDWAGGPFSPAAAFEEYRDLFRREAELRRDQIIPLWEEAADAIESLGIQVLEERGTGRHGDLRIFVEGNEAILGMPLQVS
jgi:hypothetical protein